jgi:hypothetical protein
VPYQQGTATSPVDLLQQIVTWLNGIGWTTNRSAVEGSGWTASLNKSGNFVHLRSAMNEAVWALGSYSGYGMALYLSSAFDGGQPWNNQPGSPPYGNGTTSPIGVGMNLQAGPIQNYYFFSDAAGDNIALIIEKTPGVYVYLVWGLSLQKCGTWTGGPYFAGSAPCYSFAVAAPANYPGYTATSPCPGCELDYYFNVQVWYVRVDVDAFIGKWVSGGSTNTYAPYGYTGKLGKTSIAPAFSSSLTGDVPIFAQNWGTNVNSQPGDFQFTQTSALDGRANLLPILLYAKRDTGEFSLLGSIPNIFSTDGVGHGFVQASEYVLSTTTYKMFPNFCVTKQ